MSSSMLFWDVRVLKQSTQSASDRKHNATQMTPYTVPDKFKHLDWTWKPLFRVMHGWGFKIKLDTYYTQFGHLLLLLTDNKLSN